MLPDLMWGVHDLKQSGHYKALHVVNKKNAVAVFCSEEDPSTVSNISRGDRRVLLLMDAEKTKCMKLGSSRTRSRPTAQIQEPSVIGRVQCLTLGAQRRTPR